MPLAITACNLSLSPLDDPAPEAAGGGTSNGSTSNAEQGASDGVLGESSDADGSSDSDPDAPEPPPDVEADGWLVFLSDLRGVPELYAVTDNGDQLVRLSGPLSNDSAATNIIHEAKTSWDGRRIAWSSRFVDGAVTDEASIWVMDTDGSNLRAVVSNLGRLYRVGWAADNRTLFYVDYKSCDEDIASIDVESDAPPVIRVELDKVPLTTPTPCRSDPTRLLLRRQVCNAEETLVHYDLSTGAFTPVPGATGRFEYWGFSWNDECSEVLFSNNDAQVTWAIDLSSGQRREVIDTGASPHRRAIYGNDDRRIYVPRCTVDDCDIWVSDLDAGGEPYPLGVALWSEAETVSWARLPLDIDSDGDGVADGLGR